MKAKVAHRKMQFKRPSGTSRGILNTKDSWFLELSDDDGNIGIGECSTIDGLSIDPENGLLSKLDELVQLVNTGEVISYEHKVFLGCPALLFCYEMALTDLETKGDRVLFQTSFLRDEGIPINGLVWMGEKEFMYEQIKTLLDQGYNCIKLKIAAIDFEEELSLLKYIRSQFSSSEIEIRVDANGGFTVDSALENLSRLSDYGLHSIEQPIKQGQIIEMARLCRESPLAIALDEELIGINDKAEKLKMLRDIKPQYVILKPSLIGGFSKSQEYIDLCNELNIDWWVTSALEANIGLNAIAQWTSSLSSDMHQGLGTGQLFGNNINSPLHIEDGHLYHGTAKWDNIQF